jgi:hypothetical protein
MLKVTIIFQILRHKENAKTSIQHTVKKAGVEVNTLKTK